MKLSVNMNQNVNLDFCVLVFSSCERTLQIISDCIVFFDCFDTVDDWIIMVVIGTCRFSWMATTRVASKSLIASWRWDRQDVLWLLGGLSVWSVCMGWLLTGCTQRWRASCPAGSWLSAAWARWLTAVQSWWLDLPLSGISHSLELAA